MKKDFYNEQPIGDSILKSFSKNYKGQSRGIKPWLKETNGFSLEEKEKINKAFHSIEAYWKD